MREIIDCFLKFQRDVLPQRVDTVVYETRGIELVRIGQANSLGH